MIKTKSLLVSKELIQHNNPDYSSNPSLILKFSMFNSRSKTSRGFTIVELLVVIVVIGILAAITIVSYTGVTQKATSASLQSDLTSAYKQLSMDFVVNNIYPTTLAVANEGKGLSASSDTSYQYSVNNVLDSQSFCLNATKNNQSYTINQNGTLLPGGKSFISRSNISSYTPYSTTPAFSENILSTVYTSTTDNLLAIHVNGFYTENAEYTISGIMKKNGVPVTQSMWLNNMASTYAGIVSNVSIDNATGRFNITQAYPVNSQWLLHTRFQGTIAGDVFTIENFKFEKGNNVTCWTIAP